MQKSFSGNVRICPPDCLSRFGNKQTTMANDKKLTAADSFEDTAYLELGKAYLKMGQWEDALAQYRILAQHYESSGMEDKSLKVAALMARIDSIKLTSGKEITAAKHSMKLKGREAVITRPGEAAVREAPMGKKGKEAYFDLSAELQIAKSEGTKDYREISLSEQAPGGTDIFRKIGEISGTDPMELNSNYNMGLACLELGLIDDAIQRFQIAYEKRENPFEAARLLGMCFKEKTMWTEASQAFEKALNVGGISRADVLAVKCELGLIFTEQEKREEALEPLITHSAVERRFRKAKAGVTGDTKKSAKWDPIYFFHTQDGGFQCGDTRGTLSSKANGGIPLRGVIRLILCHLDRLKRLWTH